MEWRLGDSLGISVTDETLERATRVKRLIGRPQESAQSERKSTTRYGDDPFLLLFWNIFLFSTDCSVGLLDARPQERE
ncbi:hypothetical protein [Lysinibacillus sp. TE18511]